MRIVAQFDPSQSTSDTFNGGFSNGSGRIVVYNESNINLALSWGAFSTYCPAWTAMLYCIQSDSVNISWNQQSQLVANGSPISQVIVEAFDANETILGTYPAPLVRQTNIGNAVGLASSATSVANDGNVAGTVIVESTVSGDTTSAVKLTNDGKLTLGDAAHPGSLSTDNNLWHTDGAGNEHAQDVHVNGDLYGAAGLLTVGDGIQLQSGKTHLLGSASICGASHFSGTGSGTYNHNYSNGTPNTVLICPSSAGSATIGTSNITSTQVTVTLGASLNFNGFATSV